MKKNYLPKFFESLPSSRLELEEGGRLGSSHTKVLGLEVTNIRSTEILWNKIEYILAINRFDVSPFIPPSDK